MTAATSPPPAPVPVPVPARLPNAKVFWEVRGRGWQEVARRDVTVPEGAIVEIVDLRNDLLEMAVQVTPIIARNPMLLPAFAQSRYRCDGENVIDTDGMGNDILPVEFGRWLYTHGVCCHHLDDATFREWYAILVDSIPQETPP